MYTNITKCASYIKNSEAMVGCVWRNIRAGAACGQPHCGGPSTASPATCTTSNMPLSKRNVLKIIHSQNSSLQTTQILLSILQNYQQLFYANISELKRFKDSKNNARYVDKYTHLNIKKGTEQGTWQTTQTNKNLKRASFSRTLSCTRAFIRSTDIIYCYLTNINNIQRQATKWCASKQVGTVGEPENMFANHPLKLCSKFPAFYLFRGHLSCLSLL